MLHTKRLNIPYDKDGNAQEIVEKALEKLGLTMDDIKVSLLPAGNSHGTHYGSWCLLPLIDNENSRALADEINGSLDLPLTIIEHSDIEALEVGDKVSIKTTGILGHCDDKGTVVSIKEWKQEEKNWGNGFIMPAYSWKEVTIRRYKSQKYGYRFIPGDYGYIEKGW